MPNRQDPITSSHKDASNRIANYLKSSQGIELKPTAALEVLALALGAQNWQTLNAMAKQGRTPAGVVALPGNTQAGASVPFESTGSSELDPAVWSDDMLRRLWRESGGSFHGPNIETGKMPESRLLPFLREVMQLHAEALGPAARAKAPSVSVRDGRETHQLGGTPSAAQTVSTNTGASNKEISANDFINILYGKQIMGRWGDIVPSRDAIIDQLEKRELVASKVSSNGERDVHILAAGRALFADKSKRNALFDDIMRETNSGKVSDSELKPEKNKAPTRPPYGWFRTEQQVLDVFDMHEKKMPSAFITYPSGALYCSDATMYELAVQLRYGRRIEAPAYQFKEIIEKNKPGVEHKKLGCYSSLLAFARDVMALP